jgi:gamma-glutamylcyclotransferase (GGCT)/AIG2-like uncharacterized protein YtfP
MSANLFVYGTLMPGHGRWSSLEPFVAGSPRVAQVPGRLYRTPYGWPAAVFDPQLYSLVPGVLVALAPTVEVKSLAAIDAIEGVSTGLFQRVCLTTTSEERCWGYHWPASTQGFEEIPDWTYDARSKRRI